MGKWLAMLDEEIGLHQEEIDVEKSDKSETEKLRPLTNAEKDLIREWLEFIGETEERMIDDCLVRSERMPDVRKYFIGRAVNELPGIYGSCLDGRENLNGE